MLLGLMASIVSFISLIGKLLKLTSMKLFVVFFAGFGMPRSWTSILILPVPKSDCPTEFKHLRLISLCNFSSNVISNILSSRLGPLLQKIISPKKSGFVKGRLIQNNILLAQELFHFINKKIRGPI